MTIGFCNEVDCLFRGYCERNNIGFGTGQCAEFVKPIMEMASAVASIRKMSKR
jgi:hypothetical protein